MNNKSIENYQVLIAQHTGSSGELCLSHGMLGAGKPSSFHWVLPSFVWKWGCEGISQIELNLSK